MNRGRRGESIFQGKGDYLCFIDLLKETGVDFPREGRLPLLY
jgi:hypothetical protein